MDETPYEKKDGDNVVATPAAAAHADVVAAAKETEDLNDCGHAGPGFTAASGTETVRHCGKCAGMSGY